MNPAIRFVSMSMLGLAVYVGGWYVGGSFFQLVQLGAIGLFLAAGFFALMTGGTRRIELCAAEYILGSAFMFATGRAPMVNTSRKMPPTPVAAP